MITPEEIQDYKKVLEEEKRRVMEALSKESVSTDFGSDVDGGDEEADEAEEFANKAAMQQELKVRLDDIESALRKIDQKKYGACEKCEKELGEDILRVIPESALCKECKLVQ